VLLLLLHICMWCCLLTSLLRTRRQFKLAHRRFHSWHPTTLLPYLGSCLLLVAFAILHEALASWRVSFAKSNAHSAPHGYVAVAGSERFKEKSLLQLRVTNSLLYTANITTGGLLQGWPDRNIRSICPTSSCNEDRFKQQWGQTAG
jgi:hypothetical protein